VDSWSFLTNHARVLLCIARDPGVRLRDAAARLGITERSAHAIIADLTAAGYLVKHKHGRRNHYQIQVHLPLPEPASQELAIGDVLALLVGDGAAQNLGDQRLVTSTQTPTMEIGSSVPKARRARAGR
jgi:predicted DNA-binding transcriptional regulator YafY